MKKTVAPFLRTPYNYDMEAASDESGLKCEDASKAKQSEFDSTDINHLVKRYLVTGEMPQRQLPPLNMDFEEVPDFQTAMNRIVEAERSFMQLPAEIRGRFQNDAGAFVNFCSNEENSDEMRQMGLWSPEAVTAFELKAQTAADLAEANRRDAEEFRKNSKKGDTKGVT